MRALTLSVATGSCWPPARMQAPPGPAGPPSMNLPPEDACGAPGLQNLVGQPLAAFEAVGHDGTVRVIRPGQAVTMDYGPNRLNVVLDDRDRIIRINCG